MTLFLGTARNSRLEYRTLNGRYKDDYDFQIDIKTMADDGIIFYASDLNKQDLIAVYILDGKVRKYFPSNRKIILQIILILENYFFRFTTNSTAEADRHC